MSRRHAMTDTYVKPSHVIVWVADWLGGAHGWLEKGGSIRSTDILFLPFYLFDWDWLFQGLKKADKVRKSEKKEVEGSEGQASSATLEATCWPFPKA